MGKIKVAEICDVKCPVVLKHIEDAGYEIIDGNPEEPDCELKTYWIVDESGD